MLVSRDIFVVLGVSMVILSLTFGDNACLDGCQIESNIKCRISQAPCIEVDKHPESVVEDWPGSPTDLSLALVQGGQNPSLNISWALPRDDSFRYITGFLLRILNTESDTATCVTFDLSGTDWDKHDPRSQMKFEYSCFDQFMYGFQYFIQVQSVPKHFSDNTAMAFINVLADNTEVPGAWNALITTELIDSDNCSCPDVQVTFTQSPDTPRSYTIFLKNETWQSEAQTIDHDSTVINRAVTFQHICEGAYKISLAPSQRKIDGSCTCGDIGFFNCESCFRIETRLPFNVSTRCDETSADFTSTTDTQSKPVSPESPSSFNLYVLIIVVAVLLVCLVIIAVIVITCHTKKQSDRFSVSGDFTGVIPPRPLDDFKSMNSHEIREFNDAQSLTSDRMNNIPSATHLANGKTANGFKVNMNGILSNESSVYIDDGTANGFPGDRGDCNPAPVHDPQVKVHALGREF